MHFVVWRLGSRDASLLVMRETPLQVLRRRSAAGEISIAEYEERKSRLQPEDVARTRFRLHPN